MTGGILGSGVMTGGILGTRAIARVPAHSSPSTSFMDGLVES